MDILEFICVMTVILVSGGLLFVAISTKNALKVQELMEKQRIAAERTKAAKARYAKDEQEGPAPWLAEILTSFGVDPMVIFEDEIPPELKKLLPFAKSFIQGGGLKKLLGGGAPEEPGADERASI